MVGEDLRHAGNSGNVPVKRRIKRQRAGRPDVVVGVPRAENLCELCPAGQLDQRLVKVLIGEIGGVKIRGHGQQPPLQAVVLQDAGGFPGGGQKPDGEPPESFDGQMPNGEKSELPDGEVPEMPSGERPTPPSGQGSPADGNAPAGDSTSDTTPTA